MPVSLSGFSSQFDTDGVIKKLVEVERGPVNRMEREKQDLENKKVVWNNLKSKLQKLDSSVNELFGFRRVFRKRKINSNGDDYFTTSVMDNTAIGSHTIEIKRLASSHKITTDKIPLDKQLPGAVFTIQVGEDKVEIKGFKNGGTIDKLYEVLLNEAGNLLRVQKLQIDDNHAMVSLESIKTGAKNIISIIDQNKESQRLFEEAGLIKSEKPEYLKYDFNDKKPANLQFSDNGYNSSPALFIENSSDSSFPMDKKIDRGIIEFLFKSAEHPKEEKSEITGNTILQKSLKPVQIKEITIFGSDIILNKGGLIPSSSKKEKEEVSIEISDVQNNKINITLALTNSWTSQKIDLKDINYIQAVNFINRSSLDLLIDDLAVYSQKEETKSYKNVVQKPADANILINGIEMTRDKNDNLNDILEGVSLNLRRETDRPIKFEVKEDEEKIEAALDNFINQYNETLNFITEISKSSTSGKVGKPAPDNGILANDSSLMNLQSKLRSTIANSYLTSLNSKLAILAQIGISTGDIGNKNWDNIKRGLLILNKEKFTAALNEFGDKIGEIFGYDSNNDKLVDTGVGFNISEIVKLFNGVKGVIPVRIDTADTLVKRKNENIQVKEDQLLKYEKNLRSKFGKMERNLESLKTGQKALDNQMKNLPSASSKEKEE